MKPTIGRIVHYHVTQSNVEHCARLGIIYSVGDIAPMLITRLYAEGHVNGQVYFDGPDVLFALGVGEGTKPGQWSWPPRE